MVAGGSESCIHPLTFAGFGRSRSLSTAANHDPTSSCRPFDRDRDGFVVAEGAAVLILEELEHAKARGANILAELAGYGCSGDAYHMTAPREDGSGALLAMKRALKHANTKPAQIDYINAHATSTLVGDAAEARAIRSLMLGHDGVEKQGDVTVSSTKGALGHLLGAAGAIEAIFAVLSISEVNISETCSQCCSPPLTTFAERHTSHAEPLQPGRWYGFQFRATRGAREEGGCCRVQFVRLRRNQCISCVLQAAIVLNAGRRYLSKDRHRSDSAFRSKNYQTITDA